MEEMVAALIGALVGAAVGFGGIVWQFSAQRVHEKRQLGAELIFKSEKLRTAYLEEVIRGIAVRGAPAFLKSMDTHEDEMVLILRTWELVGDKKTYALASRHAVAAISYNQFASQQINHGSKPGHGVLVDAHNEWMDSRQALINALAADFGTKWWHLRKRFQAWRMLRKQRYPGGATQEPATVSPGG